MEFRILGPVEVWSDGRRRDIGWAKERLILAVLLFEPGRPVGVDTLMGRIWDGPPQRANLHSATSRLRTGLQGLARLHFHSGAYALDVRPDHVDLFRFRALVVQARSVAESGDAAQAVRLYQDAAALRRGEPLSGLDSGWAARTREGLEKELLAATVERIGLELRLGRQSDLLGELAELTERFPHDVKPAELRMLALYRAGRAAEALAAYAETRERFMHDLDADVPPALRDLRDRILRGDPGLTPPARAAEPPFNLPLPVPHFTGRAAELAELAAHADSPDGPVVLTIDGMPGVGKTALAVRLAHDLSDRFPDGQLYLNLRGHSPGEEALGQAGALDRLLRLLDRSPAASDHNAALWRSELAHLRLIVVLDDVPDLEWIRELLPGRGSYLAIVTSRRRAGSLDAVGQVSLDVLPPADAHELLTRVAGPRSGDPDAVAQVVAACGHLPLALQLAGRRLRGRPAWTAADLAVRLARGPRLAEIRDNGKELGPVFALSYLDLGEEERRAFRLLGLHLGPEFSLATAAALLGRTLAEAGRLVEALLDRHLLTEPAEDRHRFHDLLAEYAVERSAEDEPEEREEAVGRLLEHYRSRAAAAVARYHRAPAGADTSDVEEAGHWLAAETDNLLFLLGSSQVGDAYRADLAHVLAPHLETSGHWAEAIAAHEHAVRVWREAGDPPGEARARADLATVLWRSGRHEEALAAADLAQSLHRELGDGQATATVLDLIGQIHTHRSSFDVAHGYLSEAYALRESLGDTRGAADCLGHLAIVEWQRGDYPAAVAGFRNAREMFVSAGDRWGVLMADNNVGEVEFRFGHFESALEHYARAAAIADMGRQYRANWLNNVANVERATRDFDRALVNFRSALDVYRDIGDRRGEADSLNGVGQCYLDMGRSNEALIHFQMACNLAHEISERAVEATALCGAGMAHDQAGRPVPAQESLQRALTLSQSIGDVYCEARTLTALGSSLAKTDNTSLAARHWTTALKLYETLGVPEAHALRERLTLGREAAES